VTNTRTLLSNTRVSDVAKVPTYIAVLLVTAAGLYLAAPCCAPGGGLRRQAAK